MRASVQFSSCTRTKGPTQVTGVWHGDHWNTEEALRRKHEAKCAVQAADLKLPISFAHTDPVGYLFICQQDCTV